MPNRTLRLDVNRQVVNKTQDYYLLHTGYQTEEITPLDLAVIISRGHAYTAPFDKIPDEEHATSHYKANVQEVTVLWLDAENKEQGERCTLDYWLSDSFVSTYGFMVHETVSHTEDDPHSRVIYIPEKPLSVEKAELALKALFDRWPHVDQGVHDASRTLYGARDCQLKLLGRVLPLDVLESEIIKPYEAKMAAQKAAAEQNRPKPRTKSQTLATDDQVGRYIKKTINSTIQELTAALEGTGRRHELLMKASVRLNSLAKATWLTSAAADLLDNLEDDLLTAARANGYVAKYSEADTLRIIKSGFDKASPADEPLWKEAADIFKPGDYVVATVPGREPGEGYVTAVKKDNVVSAWFYQIDGAVWWPRSALQTAEPGDGYTNRIEVVPNEADNPRPAAPEPPNEALAFDTPESEADDLKYIDVDPVAVEEAKPYFRHTCKSSQEKGAAINIYLEFTTFKPFTDHDWRNCPGCRSDYRYRKARQIEREAKRGQLTLAKFATVEDWTKKRKAWNTRARRGADSISFTPFHHDDGTVDVIHSSTHEKDAGQKLPEGDELDAMVLDLCLTPGTTKNRASSGFGGEWQGSRGEGRNKEVEKKTGKRPHNYQLKTNAASVRLAKRAYGTELNTRGHGRQDWHCSDSFLALLDWQHQELLEGHEYKLEERHPQGFNNDIVKAIFSDDRVLEAQNYYRTYREANAMSPLSSIGNSSMDNKGDIPEVEEKQPQLFTTTSSDDMAVLELEGQPPPSHAPPQEDFLDIYLEIMKN